MSAEIITTKPAKSKNSRTNQIVDISGKERKKLLMTAIDEFILPLANMYVHEVNVVNIVDLCRKAARWIESPR